MVARSDKGCLVECAPDIGPFATYMAVSVSRSAVVGKGCEAGERGCLLVGEIAEFGHGDDQNAGNDRPDRGDRSEDSVATGEGFITLDCLCDGLAQRGDSLIAVLDSFRQNVPHHATCGAVMLEHKGGSLFDHLASSMRHFAEFFERFAGWRRRSRCQLSRHQRQDLCIDRIRFSKGANDLGIEPCAQRVDDGNGISCLSKTAVSRAVVFGGRFHHHTCNAQFGQFAFELSPTTSIVGDGKRLTNGMDVDIQTHFTNIDSDIDCQDRVGIGLYLALHTGLAPFHLFRTARYGGSTKLPCGPKSQGGDGPIRHPTGGWPAPGRMLHRKDGETRKAIYKAVSDVNLQDWFVDASDDFRNSLCRQWVLALANLASLEPLCILGEVITPEADARRWQDFARAADCPKLVAAYDQLLSVPAPLSGPPAIVHGDTKLSNIMWHEGRISAVLDWEMAQNGDPLADLGYMLYSFESPFHGATRAQKLKAMLTRTDVIALWSKVSGRLADGIIWHEISQIAKISAIIAEGCNMRVTRRSQDPKLELFAQNLDYYLGVTEAMLGGPEFKALTG